MLVGSSDSVATFGFMTPPRDDASNAASRSGIGDAFAVRPIPHDVAAERAAIVSRARAAAVADHPAGSNWAGRRPSRDRFRADERTARVDTFAIVEDHNVQVFAPRGVAITPPMPGPTSAARDAAANSAADRGGTIESVASGRGGDTEQGGP